MESRANPYRWPPRPRVQQWVRGISGREYRCDFGLGPRLVAEFDGKIKYGRLLRPGDIADVILREKAREDDIRAAGYMMLRWTWGTLRDGSLLGILNPWRSHTQPTPFRQPNISRSWVDETR